MINTTIARHKLYAVGAVHPKKSGKNQEKLSTLHSSYVHDISYGVVKLKLHTQADDSCIMSENITLLITMCSHS